MGNGCRVDAAGAPESAARLASPAVGMRRVGRTSGVSLGVANLVSVAILTFLLWGFALPGHLHSFGVPDVPLFGLSQASHEMERLIGPLVAALACAGLLMLLRFTIDAPPSGESFLRAARLGFKDVFVLIAGLPKQPNLLKFLVARTLYADGFHTLIIFEGIYASGVMGWHGFQLLSFAIVKIAFAGVGGVMAGELNARLGTRRAIIVEILITVVLLVMVLGTSPDRIVYLWHYGAAAEPLWSGPVFRTMPELAFLLLSGSMTAFAVASVASGRAMIRSNRAADAGRVLLRAVRPDLKHHGLDRANAHWNPHRTLPLAGDWSYSDRGLADRRRRWPAVRERRRST